LELEKTRQENSNLQLKYQKSQQEISSLQQELQKKQQEISTLNATLSRMPLSTGDLTIESIDKTIGILTEYYRSKELPDVILLFEGISKINARLVAANLCLRHGRFKRALVHLVRIGMMDPLALFSIQSLKIIVNGLIFSLRQS
jgi:hypothetical protein